MSICKASKGIAMKCFGELVIRVEKDPDPNTQDELTKKFNCANCGYYDYCKELADTLE